MRKLALLTTVAALAIAPAVAQQTTPPAGSAPSATQQAPSSQPPSSQQTPSSESSSGSSQTMPSASSSSPSAATTGAASGQTFIQNQTAEQWLGSKLIGASVMSSNNENIGAIDDLLIDRNGNVLAAIIGVGGFLGIGEKKVAVGFKSLELTKDQNDREKVMLRISKAELEKAPDFKVYTAPARTTGSGTGTTGTGGGVGTRPTSPSPSGPSR